MQTLSQEEFKKRYGQNALNQFQNPVARDEGRFDDVGQDIGATFTGAGSDLKRRFGNVQSSIEAGANQDQSLLETGGQVAGQFAGAAGDLIGRGVQGVVSPFLKQSEEDAIMGGIGGTVAAVDEQFGLSEKFDAASPRTQRNISGVAGLLEFATFKGIGSVTNKTAKSFLNKSDQVLQRSKEAIPPIRTTTLGSLDRAVTNVRFKLSDLDPDVATVLRRSDPDDVNVYFQQAKNHLNDRSKVTPLELAGGKAESAYDVINEAVANAGRGKRAILDDVATTKVAAGTLDEVRTGATQRIGERFGVELTPDGSFTTIAGRGNKLDAADSKLLNDYFVRLNALGDTPSLREVDDFVDWSQSQLYKQSKTLSTLEAADKAVVAQLKQTTGDLNGRLKTQVGGGYSEVNARIAGLLELQDELSKALGADARKGGGLMKRIYSPTAGNTRPLFEQIKQETGIDLFKEATLAKFAMESVGDTQQRSLLQSLDIGAKEAQGVDLTKPASVYNWLREHADLDGQELANEYLRQQKASGGSALPNPQ